MSEVIGQDWSDEVDKRLEHIPDDNYEYPQTQLLFAKIRLNRQANELSRQRDRIFELKRKLKVLARVISRKNAEIEELRRDMAILIAEG